MPVMDGYEFSQKMFVHYEENSFFTEHRENQMPYLVACTADCSSEVITKCTRLGFNKIIDFLTVQVLEEEILLEVIKRNQ